jgi:hypothetical protein
MGVTRYQRALERQDRQDRQETGVINDPVALLVPLLIPLLLLFLPPPSSSSTCEARLLLRLGIIITIMDI